MPKPTAKPANPNFSSGPTSKRPGWALGNIPVESLGRSHRASYPKSRLAEVIDRSRAMLDMPADYVLGIVPASDTGAFEMAMWNLLGERGVDVLAWESFGAGWVTDIKGQLRLDDVREFIADYGELPDLSAVDTSKRDTVFTWNGTTSGVRVPNGGWIAAEREALTLCDATSAVFAMPLDWDKLDVITWSWQKVLGGEAAHGMLALSPRALERLANFTPPWPLPKVFRLKSKGKVSMGLFEGSTINTPSLLAVEDHLDALTWAEAIGGLDELIARSERNLDTVANWVEQSDWADFLAADPATRSSTSICIAVTHPAFTEQPADTQRELITKMARLLEDEGVARDIGGYRDAPPGIRIWGGGTVETQDMEALLPWLDWAWDQVRD